MKYVIIFVLFMVNILGTTLKFYGDDEFAPFSYEENGELKGIDIEILREVEKIAGYTFDIKLVPWNRLLELTKQGRIDGSFSLFYNEERAKYSIFTKIPLHVSTFSLYTLKEKSEDFNKMEDLKGKRIGVNSGFYISKNFEDHAKSKYFILEESENIDKNIKLLVNNRIDLFMSNEYVLKTYIEENNLESSLVKVKNGLLQEVSGAYLVFSKNRQLEDKEIIIEKINKALEELRKNGTIERIEKKYNY